MTTDAIQPMSSWPSATNLGVEARDIVYRAFETMPRLFLAAAAFAVVLAIAPELYRTYHTRGIGGDLIHLLNARTTRIVFVAILVLGHLGLSAYVAVTIHRFILLHEVARGFASFANSSLWIYCLWLAAIWSAAVPVYMFATYMDIPPVIPDVLLIWALLRIGLALPAVAIGTPSTSPLERIRTSIRRTRANILKLFLAGIVAMVPLFILVAVGAIPLMLIAGLAGEFVFSSLSDSVHRARVFFDLIISPITGIFALAVGAAVASCAYRFAVESENPSAPRET